MARDREMFINGNGLFLKDPLKCLVSLLCTTVCCPYAVCPVASNKGDA